MIAVVQLDLFEDVVAFLWYGRCPRSLMRVALALYLRPEPQKSMRDLDSLMQLELFPAVTKRPPQEFPGEVPSIWD